MITQENLSKLSAPNRNNGYMMVEVLVTILVVSLGLFGILAVIINSLKLSSSSNYRTIAAQQANAMADVLRANPTTLAYDSTVVVTNADCNLQLPGICSFSRLSPNPGSASSGCFQAGGCNRSSLINTAFYTWQANLRTILPSGDGTICRDNNPVINVPTNSAGTWSFNCSNGLNDPFVVKICWGEANIKATTATSGNGGMMCSWSAI